jgi:hypothetical protein
LRLPGTFERLFAVRAGESVVPSVGVELIATTGVCVRYKRVWSVGVCERNERKKKCRVA